MEKDLFLTILRDELIKRGLTPEVAQRHVRSISLTLTAEDVKAIEHIDDHADIEAIAEGIASVKLRTSEKKAEPKPEEFSPVSVDKRPTAEKKHPAPVHIEDEEEAVVTPPLRASTKSRLLFVCTIPLFLLLLALYLGVFALGFSALLGIIVLLVAALIGGVAAGATVSLVGIIYGITQLLTATSAAPGLYEIGLGLAVAGIVMLGGILIYNCAIRLIPWVIRLLGKLFKLCAKKLKQLFRTAKEASYKL